MVIVVLTTHSSPKVGIRCHAQPSHPPHLYNLMDDSKLSYCSPVFVILANIINGFMATMGYIALSENYFFHYL